MPDAHHPTGDRRPAVEIYVKASRREGRGGWGAVLRQNEHTRSLSGNEPEATSNTMLIRGATEALRALSKPCRVILYSDASYLIQGASVWAKKWQAYGWKTTDGKPVSNRAEWEALLEAAQPHQVTWLLARGDTAPDDLRSAGELASGAAAPGGKR
jgi:ribonuclease HI